ncbi:MAG TPA: CoA-binding protein [Syntrophorhabdaceae bacterium]|nr:CoA-binding protein [Syntrophorhabdaceae bacterium]
MKLDPQEEKEKEVLEQSRVIAMVGLSPDTEKASNRVANYLLAHGYSVIPVNPGYEEILGRKSYKTLSEIPEKVDVVDIFMRSEKVLPYVEQAVKLKPRAIWLQLGIINDEAKRLAEDAGITFFMNVCMKQEHEKIFGSNK